MLRKSDKKKRTLYWKTDRRKKKQTWWLDSERKENKIGVITDVETKNLDAEILTIIYK